MWSRCRLPEKLGPAPESNEHSPRYAQPTPTYKPGIHRDFSPSQYPIRPALRPSTSTLPATMARDRAPGQPATSRFSSLNRLGSPCLPTCDTRPDGLRPLLPAALLVIVWL